MKKIFLLVALFISVAGIFFSCKKETPDVAGETKETDLANNNQHTSQRHPPVANAGADQAITLPMNTVALDGGNSTDPDNNITSYLWTKISGPSSFTIKNANSVQTQVSNLVAGAYQFELKVTDATRMTGKDTVKVQVLANPDPSPPPPCTTNCGKIVFVSARDGNDEIYTCNADGSNVTRLTNDPAADGQPAWSPDGTHIAFVKNTYGESDIYIMNADGSNLVRKTFSGNCIHQAWSPDGKKIAYSDIYFDIYIMDLMSGSVSKLPDNYGSSVEPSPTWSPDGTKIAFDSDWNAWDFISDIFTIHPDGSGFNCLTKIFFGDYDYWKPSWSPDGTKLSITIHQMGSLNASGSSIGIMNSDGTGLGIIKTGNMGEFNAVTKTSWSPDGKRIAYTSWGTDNVKTIAWVAANGSASGTIISNGWDADWSRH